MYFCTRTVDHGQYLPMMDEPDALGFTALNAALDRANRLNKEMPADDTHGAWRVDENGTT